MLGGRGRNEAGRGGVGVGRGGAGPWGKGWMEAGPGAELGVEHPLAHWKVGACDCRELECPSLRYGAECVLSPDLPPDRPLACPRVGRGRSEQHAEPEAPQLKVWEG